MSVINQYHATIKSTRVDHLYSNNLIIYGHIRKLEKDIKLFMVIPSEIYEQIVVFCGKEKILIPSPIITFKSVSDNSFTLNIKNKNGKDYIMGYRIKYKNVDENDEYKTLYWSSDKNENVVTRKSNCCPLCDARFTLFQRRHFCRECGNVCCSDCSKHRQITSDDKHRTIRICDLCFSNYVYVNYELISLKPNTNYMISVESKNRYDMYAIPLVITAKTNAWDIGCSSPFHTMYT
eukprot:80723_1